VRIACVLLVFCASLASAQTTEPKLSDAAHAKIRDIQLQQKALENQYLQMQQQLVNLEKQFNGLTTQLSAETDAAYKEAKVTREDWTLDMNTLAFAKVEKPKPEEKKPAAAKP
jgi:predicted  nucleic acid-binding Zn-ribbon protein